MSKKVAQLAKELYPEDLFCYATGLTEGELNVLKHLREELEKRVRPVLIESHEKALLPREEILGAFAADRIMDHPVYLNVAMINGKQASYIMLSYS